MLLSRTILELGNFMELYNFQSASVYSIGDNKISSDHPGHLPLTEYNPITMP